MSKSNPFLPDDYEPPADSGGKYLNPSKINHSVKIRILSSPLVGYEAWKDKKPVRGKTVQDVVDKGYDMVDSYGKAATIKFFWALKVYDHGAGQVKILNITQSTIREPIEALAKGDDWGDPREYDMLISKEGEAMETKYSVTPLPPKPLPDDAKEIIKNTPIRLEKLYEGGDPFDTAAGGDDSDMPI